MPPQKLETAPPLVSDPDASDNNNYISLESTIQAIRDGRPKNNSSSESSRPTLFDGAAAEYDTAVLGRLRLTKAVCETAELLHATTRKAQPQAPTPAHFALLGILNPSRASHPAHTGLRISVTASLARPTRESGSEYSPTHGLGTAVELPSPFLDDEVSRVIRSVEIKAGWHPWISAHAPARGLRVEEAGAQLPVRPPVFTRPPANEETTRPLSRLQLPALDPAYTDPHSTTRGENDKSRRILGDILNRQYVRRRENEIESTSVLFSK
ncbi:hypothetical protein C8R46DRAFT_1117722 [Mycena filopes]|nr:hypothetical protein C8R46DRAFT_1117722 [Mycena filopes]